MFQRYSGFYNMRMRCLMTSSTPHIPIKRPQIRNLSSNITVHIGMYLLFPQIFHLYGISGVDDIIRDLICIIFKTKISLKQDEKLNDDFYVLLPLQDIWKELRKQCYTYYGNVVERLFLKLNVLYAIQNIDVK